MYHSITTVTSSSSPKYLLPAGNLLIKGNIKLSDQQVLIQLYGCAHARSYVYIYHYIYVHLHRGQRYYGVGPFNLVSCCRCDECSTERQCYWKGFLSSRSTKSLFLPFIGCAFVLLARVIIANFFFNVIHGNKGEGTQRAGESCQEEISIAVMSVLLLLGNWGTFCRGKGRHFPELSYGEVTQMSGGRLYTDPYSWGLIPIAGTYYAAQASFITRPQPQS